MPITIKYLPQPDIRPLGESGKERYVLNEDYSFAFYNREGLQALTIMKGFKYDGASVPRWAMALIGFERDGVHRAASLVHDWLYVNEGVVYNHNTSEDKNYTYNRHEADTIFLKGMEYHGIKSWHTRIAYITVRGLGWIKRRF